MRFTSFASVMLVVLGACSKASESKAISEDSMTPASDTGQSSAESDPLDTGTYEPVVPDTGEAPSGEEDVSLPGYCDGAPEHVTCSPDVNLDDWWSFAASQRFETVTGKILSLPFTIRGSVVDGGGASSTTVEGPFVDATNFRLWFSAEPGGVPLSVTSRCDSYFKQARFTLPWTQNPEHEGNERYCFLGEGPRVLYVNVEVCAHLPPDWECSDERQGDYIFNLSSSYRQW